MIKPNILFIQTDQQTISAMGCVDRTFKTPNLDKLAKSGIRFTESYCSASVCLPSRNNMWTGCRSIDNGKGKNKIYDKKIKNINLGQVFSKTHKCVSIGKHPPTNFSRTPIPKGMFGTAIAGYDDFVLEKSLERLDEISSNVPFFYFVSFINPHDICCASKLKILGTNEQKYQQLVTLVDKQIGTFLDEFYKRGLDENTIIIFTSDHGSKGKGRYIQEGIQIPLLISWKDKIKPRVSNDLISHIDLFPTLCDLCNIHKPHTITGVSQMEQLLNNKSCREYLEVESYCRLNSCFFGKTNQIQHVVRYKDYKLTNFIDNDTKKIHTLGEQFTDCFDNEIIKNYSYKHMYNIFTEWRNLLIEKTKKD